MHAFLAYIRSKISKKGAFMNFLGNDFAFRSPMENNHSLFFCESISEKMFTISRKEEK